MQAVVAERGQVTIPYRLRMKLGITPKTVLNFREEGGRLVAEKEVAESPVRRVMGCLKTRKSTDELIRELRGTP
jgi:bifunctional DNA-binding transcriptional regulator/antitoxin component of YhaV-PrlF toxin-antitoxin module